MVVYNKKKDIDTDFKTMTHIYFDNYYCCRYSPGSAAVAAVQGRSYSRARGETSKPRRGDHTVEEPPGQIPERIFI